jgi:type VI secretion system secreted protein Hcp
MPISISELTVPAGSTGADIFLHLQAKRAGKIKGEAVTPGHVDDILISAWEWGLEARMAPGFSGKSHAGRAYSALTVHKTIDRATTALMAALATNDEIKEAKLCARRAGGQQEDYFIVTLKKARITSLRHQTLPSGFTQEVVAISFTEVQVEYLPQQGTGLRSGSTTFNDVIHAEDGE